MKIHRNAKTNMYQRRLLITRVRRRGWTQRRAAEAAGVSVRTVAKWLARRALVWFRRCGIAIRRLLTDNAMAYRGHAVERVCRATTIPPSLYAPVSAANEWQSRARHSNALAGMGLSCALSEFRAPHGGAPAHSPLLQPLSSPHEPRSTPTEYPFPRGHLMNNLFDIHS
jgi:lambda repressor-like predicted transcriptional regulator